MTTTAWHTVDPAGALAALGSRPTGLDSAQAQARLAEHGPNEAPQARPPSSWTLLARQVADPMIVVLIVAGALALVLGEGVDAAVVFAVVVANALIGFAQEQRADRAIRALAAMVPEAATVVRDGTRAVVPAREVVPGDVVVLARGDRVPADGRLLATRLLEVDESALTGESLAVTKSVGAVPAQTPVADRTCVVYGGTIVTSGQSRAVVFATGGKTELGRISAMVHEAAPLQTPLTRTLSRFAWLMAWAIAGIAAIVLVVALARGYAVDEAALATISLAVAAIPEGLPAIVTISLAVGVRRMARRHAVVRRLPAVETLGSTTVICTDKTGTLTRNAMAVTALWTHHGISDDELLRAAVLCSDAAADGRAGQPTELALVAAAHDAGVDAAAVREAAPRVDAIPFEPEHKLMATQHVDGRLYVKGAPDAVLPRCVDATAAATTADALAHQGMRVLAIASGSANGGLRLDGLEGLTVLGLAGISDPVREDAAAAVAACRAAGIEVKMITGDHAATASAVARQVGMLDTAVLSGPELDALEGDAFADAAARTTIFSRVAPEHKLRLVRALQDAEHVVAMTGDGVNDAPALRQSDIGVAMGVTGTAVAREAADVVLTDDRFSTIAAAVEEGRRVYDNLQKAIAFILPTNLGEALILVAAVLAFPFADGEPLLPVSPTQILWVNLIATVSLALPLAMEVAEPNIMARPPRPPGSPVVTRFLVARTVLVSILMTGAAIALFLVHYDDSGLAESQTLVVTTIVLFQVVYLLQCRSLRGTILEVGVWSNPWAWAGIAAILALQTAFIYFPPLQSVFGTAALDVTAWLEAAAAAAVLIPAVAIEEAVRRRHAPPGTA